MPAKQKTLPEILGELRTWPKGHPFQSIADEVEAAVARERAKYEHLHECFWNVDAIQNIIRQLLDERDDLRDRNPKASESAAHFARLLTNAATPAPGIALKIREALEWVDRFFSYDGSGTSTDAATLAIEASTKTREALAAPARNCDRFKTLDEAREAFQDLRGHKILADVELWDSMDEAGALVRWLFATAEGGDNA